MGRKLLIKNAKTLRRVAQNYFASCDERGVPYTMSGLAAALGIKRTTLCSYAHRDEFSEEIEALKQRIEQQMEERMLTGASAATPSIFSLKNNYGWKDKVEIEGNIDVSSKNLANISNELLMKLLPIDKLKEIEDKSKLPYQKAIDAEYETVSK